MKRRTRVLLTVGCLILLAMGGFTVFNSPAVWSARHQIPVYLGSSDFQAFMGKSSTGAEAEVATFSTRDNIKAVLSFYDAFLPANGWQKPASIADRIWFGSDTLD